MSVFNVGDLVDFPESFRTILYEHYGAAEAEEYAYYQRYRRSMFKEEADLFNFHLSFFRAGAAVSQLECTLFTHEDIVIYEIVRKKSGDEVAVLSRAQFFDIRKDFYENEGRRMHSKEGPTSVLYFSANILTYLGEDMGISLFNRRVVPNDFAQQIDAIYREMKRRNYHLYEETTVKEFYKDIIVHIYPQMSNHDQNFCWRFLKSQEFLIRH